MHWQHFKLSAIIFLSNRLFMVQIANLMDATGYGRSGLWKCQLTTSLSMA